MKFLLSLLLVIAGGFAGVWAQTREKQIDQFTRENNLKRAKNPDGLLFTVRLKDK